MFVENIYNSLLKNKGTLKVKILTRQKLHKRLRKLSAIKHSHFDFKSPEYNIIFFCLINIIIYCILVILNPPVLYGFLSFLLMNLIVFLYFTAKNGLYNKRKSKFKKSLKLKEEKLRNEIEKHSFENNFDLYFEEIKELKKNNKIHLIDESVLESFIYKHKKYKEQQQKKNNKFSYFNDEEKHKITIT